MQGDTMTKASIVLLNVARAERFLEDYEAGLVSRDETKSKLMAAFGLDDADAEMVLAEVDAQ
jgi:hypothetical protein